MYYKLLIKKYRIKCGMTQEELAIKSKVRQAYISQLEEASNLKKNPTVRTLLRIAKALNVCPHQLIRSSTECKYNCANKCKQKFFKLNDKTTVYIENDLKKDVQVQLIRNDDGESLSALINKLLKRWLKEQGKR